jgi:hypothetical protein
MKIKNKTKKEFIVPGIGIVKPGEIVEAPKGFHNINFEKVETIKKEEVKIK